MKLLPQKLTLALLGAALLVAAGCAKKPIRPDPSSTVLGQTGGGPADGINSGNLGATDGTAPLLVDRGPGVIETEDKIIGLIQPVYFDTDQSGIKAGERPKLQAAKDYLDKNPQHRVLFEGRCDWRGTGEYNLALGDRRAGAAKKYLETLGVPAARIEVLSKGDLDAVENSKEEDMAKDRRAEIVILKK